MVYSYEGFCTHWYVPKRILLPAPELKTGCFFPFTLVLYTGYERDTLSQTAKGHLFCLLVFFQFYILRATALLLSNVCIRSSLSFLLLPAVKLLFESASLHPKSLLHTSG